MSETKGPQKFYFCINMPQEARGVGGVEQEEVKSEREGLEGLSCVFVYLRLCIRVFVFVYLNRKLSQREWLEGLSCAPAS